MKALIPVAGAGIRLRPHTYTQPKPLIPVAGKPILGHIVDELISAGFTEFVFIIGYLGEKVKDFVEKNYGNFDCQFILQSEREGLGHAVWMARDAIQRLVKGSSKAEAGVRTNAHSNVGRETRRVAVPAELPR